MRSRLHTAEVTLLGNLDPRNASDMLPALDAADLSVIKASGWERVGIVAALVDPEFRVLTLQHRPSGKSPAGALGPLAETGHVAKLGEDIVVETAGANLSRAIHEELGVDQPSRLRLTARWLGAWTLNSWPVGIGYQAQHALAICPVAHLDEAAKEMLMDTFTGTEEIEAISFQSVDGLLAAENVRPGTHTWLGDIMSSGLMYTPATERELVSLPEPSVMGGAVDIKFREIDYL